MKRNNPHEDLALRQILNEQAQRAEQMDLPEKLTEQIMGRIMETEKKDTIELDTVASDIEEPIVEEIKPKKSKKMLIGKVIGGTLNLRAEPDSDSDIISVKGEVREIDGEKFFTLAYTQENTLPNADNKATYATALEFTGEYISNGTPKGESKVTYYIRHCDPDNDAAETSPMKYGIVRNNIYRVKVSKVNKQDPAIPDGKALLDLNIKVKKWHVKTHSEIVM